MKITITMISLLLGVSSWAQGAFGEVNGYLLDSKKQPLSGARVYIQDQDKIYQQRTELDGGFRLSAVPAGNYLINFLYMGDTMKNVPITIPMDAIARMGDVVFVSKTQMMDDIVIIANDPNRIKLINGDLPVPQMDAKAISQSAVRFDQKKMLASMSSEIRLTDDGDLVFRGARKGDMLYMIDGVKSSQIAQVPSCSIGRVMVYTGGLPAKYGDTLGGVVVMETKSYFDLYREWESQQIKAGKM